ncbi:putative amino acid transporter, transmembrane domain-containing protein [Helianthus debilis subsp. tardiflorus]
MICNYQNVFRTGFKELIISVSYFCVSFVTYTAVGVYGYLMFGDSEKSQFTLNMPSHYVSSKVAAWTVVCMIIIFSLLAPIDR